MTRREYAESRINHYRQLFWAAPLDSVAEWAYLNNIRQWVSFLKFHDYMKGTQ